MLINLTKELTQNSLLSHIVLHGIAYAAEANLAKTIASESPEPGDTLVDVVIMANGHELNLDSFVDHWQKQVDGGVNKQASEIIRHRFMDLTDLLDDLEQRVKPEIDKRLEDWEKEGA